MKTFISLFALFLSLTLTAQNPATWYLNGGGNGIQSPSSTASGWTSTAMGFVTTAEGYVSTAMGYTTYASGYVSTAMGWQTIASGSSSTAMGANTEASGFGSTATVSYTHLTLPTKA